MTFKSVTAWLAISAIAIGAAGLARAQASDQGWHTAAMNLVAENNNKNHNKSGAHVSGGNKSTTHTFSGAKGGAKTSSGSHTVKKYNAPKFSGSHNTKTFSGSKTGTHKYSGSNTVKTYNAPKKSYHNYGVKSGGSKYSKPKANVRVITPKHGFSAKVTGKRMRGLPHTGYGHFHVRGRNFSTWRGPHYRRRYHDRWYTFVPLNVLAAILYDNRHYYPYAYISAPEDYCYGRTEDGCFLNWEEVETLEGYHVGQCVAYCPWRD